MQITESSKQTPFVKPAVIYIMGSGHSGSTMLQFLLAAHPGVVGLGEVFQPAGRTVEGSTPCSCGANFASCPVWAGTVPAESGQAIQWYTDFARKISHLYPQAAHWIDSSKISDAVMPWETLLRENIISGIRVLYLVRDVRGWVLSDQKARQRKAKSPRKTISSMKVWTREQKKTLDFLKNSSLDFKVVSYESLIFNTRSMLEKIALFCGLTGRDHPWEDRLRTAEVHDVMGNRVKNDPRARGRLIYDDKWQYSLPVNLLTCILPPVWKLNRELRTKGGL